MNIRVVTEMMGGSMSQAFSDLKKAQEYFEQEKKRVDSSTNIFWTEMVVVADSYTGSGEGAR
ncbi:hypothetical protein [Melghirimyces algeriensis]|uniref:Uncharacterized protein n=1 Tax=Melghirimyces algeriensis TaxID=910412 RepID=A0A521C4P0_9BACL|nr:hypothetical protein [Melghirimyces algeriensis]SMO54447.1 hypothetical protein SAMN06264849_103128 [Melghirimyces algeriensis]